MNTIEKNTTLRSVISLLPCPKCSQPFRREDISIKGDFDGLVIVKAVCRAHPQPHNFELVVNFNADNQLSPSKTVTVNDLLDFKNKVKEIKEL